MKALHHFIVRIDKKYKDTIKLGNKELYLQSKFNEHQHRIPYGEIVAAPSKHYTGAVEGDVLFFHHHVIMNSSLHLGEDLYLVMYSPDTSVACHAIAYRDGGGDINMLGGWIFLEPPEKTEGYEYSESGIIVDIGLNRKPENKGTLMSTTPDLERQGLKVGDVVYYSKNSDYEMELDDGKKVYRMRDSDLMYAEA